MTERNRMVDLDVTLLYETEAAYKVQSADTGKVAWVPKSQCELDNGCLTMPEWLAMDKSLV